jgi:hypothetical protein
VSAGRQRGRVHQAGRYIDWDGRAYFSEENGNVSKGIPHNQFLVTALQAMGLAPADYETGGKPGYGSTSVNSRTSDTCARSTTTCRRSARSCPGSAANCRRFGTIQRLGVVRACASIHVT